ncbi:DUF3108 domain-containing protein [Congregibacter variabilis]|uniref:DUF3108 domain-containing protein n=1 Tax=Congregibacter variabilis TaxID=3081200 RepID=A0ABZ0I319_9GAMM|nr:DUF3108 domain-containing protein [Congregibacter sp. IMCC43200]
MTVTDITILRQAKALLGCLLVAAGFLMGSAQAQEAENAPTQHGALEHEHRTLTPYDAVYKTSTSGLSIKLRRSLSLDDNGDCRLTSEGKLLVAGISEVSVFTLEGDLIQPRSYVYQLSGPVSRRREVHFDEGSSIIRSLYKKEWYELPKTGDTLDRMSQQEQLRLSLLNDPTPKEDMLFHVADGRRVKEYRLVYKGEERLETPMGWIDTLHFERDHDDPERTSGVWIAPEWDYLMVRTVHIDDGKTTEADLISASIAGTAVAGSSS